MTYTITQLKAAHARGARIQVNSERTGLAAPVWVPCPRPWWYLNPYDYRIHPDDLPYLTQENTMPKPLDLTKPVQTRDGRAARILCADAKGDRPIVALISVNEAELVRCFCPDGLASDQGGQCAGDLINVPPKVTIERWHNVYATGMFGGGHTTPESARRNADPSVLGTVKVVVYDDGTFTIEKVEA